jgi:hypothetical protein
MDEVITMANEFYISALSWLEINLLTTESIIQIGIIVVMFLLSYVVSTRLSPFVDKIFEGKAFYLKTEKIWKTFYLPVFWWIIMITAWQVAVSLNNPIILLRMATTLISVWLVIRLVTFMIESETISKITRVVAWSMAILNIFGLLGPFINLLDTTTFTFGTSTISILGT